MSDIAQELRDAADHIDKLEERIENFLHIMNGFVKAYPEDVFPTPTKEEFKEANRLLEPLGKSFGSRLHGAWGRHIASQIKEAIEPLPESICNHHWVSAVNSRVKNGSVCLKCHAISAKDV